VTFLDRAGLGVYSPVFFSYGFTTIESLQSIRPEDYQRMQVKAGHQKKLKLALENLRSAGQVHAVGMTTPVAGLATSGGNLAEASMAGLGPHGYNQRTMWADTNNEGGYQWVDGPGPQSPAAPAGALSYPVEQTTMGARPQQQQQQMHAPQQQAATQAVQQQAAQQLLQQQAQQQAQQQQPGGLPLYHYSQGGTQWVDTPADPSSSALQQDMVFQWVDSPSYGRGQQHQQHYLQPPVSPYFQGLEPPLAQSHGLDLRAPTGVGQPGQGLDAHYQAYGAAQGCPDATRYAQPQDSAGLGYTSGRGAVDQVQYGQRRDLQGTQYGHSRPPQSTTRPQGPSKGGGRGQHPSAAETEGFQKQRGQRSAASGRQDTAVERPGGAHGQTGGGKAGSGAAGASRRITEVTADPQMGAVLENMGTDDLRATLTTTLESLYEDRIKPMANYVKGRLKERSCPESIVKNFVELYAQHSDLFVVQQPSQTQADEASIFFVTEPSWFKGWVDMDSPSDPYDEALWQELAKFLDGEHTFAGGRYGMARELMQRNLPFLAPHVLGEVCHIVQLAIQHRRLIVYHRKMLKPIQTVLCQLSPANGNRAGSEGEEIKDMDDLCLVLFRMLMHHPQGIRLCRMKQVIKHEFCRKLSEMAFQCTKLIELFNQEPLAATFVLDTENDGKSIYVRLGNPDTFTDHVKNIYAVATSTESKQALPSS